MTTITISNPKQQEDECRNPSPSLDFNLGGRTQQPRTTVVPPSNPTRRAVGREGTTAIPFSIVVVTDVLSREEEDGKKMKDDFDERRDPVEMDTQPYHPSIGSYLVNNVSNEQRD